MIYLVQDRFDPDLRYIGSLSCQEAAEDLIDILYDQDLLDGEYTPDRYVIRTSDICWADRAETCGMCTHGVCMCPDPARQCPAARKEAAR